MPKATQPWCNHDNEDLVLGGVELLREDWQMGQKHGFDIQGQQPLARPAFQAYNLYHAGGSMDMALPIA